MNSRRPVNSADGAGALKGVMNRNSCTTRTSTNPFLRLASCLFLLFLVVGCGEESDWKALANSPYHWQYDEEWPLEVAAYQKFLRKHPDGKFSGEARLRLQILSYRRARYENTFKAYEEFLNQYSQGRLAADLRARLDSPIEVVLKQDYGVARDVAAQLPFDRIAETLLDCAGYFVLVRSRNAKSSFDNPHSIMMLDVAGEAMGANYRSEISALYRSDISGFHYSGAKLTFDITLVDARGQRIAKSRFVAVNIPTPFEIHRRYPTPNDAPFADGEWMFGTKIFEIVGRIRGTGAVARVLSENMENNMEAFPWESEPAGPSWRVGPAGEGRLGRHESW